MHPLDCYFPHPVLRPGSDDFTSGELLADIRAAKLEAHYRVEADLATTCKSLNLMTVADGAVLGLHIECPRTRLRAWWPSVAGRVARDLPASAIDGIVEMCPLILAAAHTGHYALDEFHPDYQGENFRIWPGDILAVGDLHVLEVDAQDMRPPASIFLVSHQAVPTMAELDASGEKAVILLGDREHAAYTRLVNARKRRELHAVVVAPALVALVAAVQSGGDDALDRRWAKVLSRHMRERNILDEGPFRVAQELLEGPLADALNHLGSPESIEEDRDWGDVE